MNLSCSQLNTIKATFFLSQTTINEFLKIGGSWGSLLFVICLVARYLDSNKHFGNLVTAFIVWPCIKYLTSMNMAIALVHWASHKFVLWPPVVYETILQLKVPTPFSFISPLNMVGNMDINEILKILFKYCHQKIKHESQDTRAHWHGIFSWLPSFHYFLLYIISIILY